MAVDVWTVDDDTAMRTAITDLAVDGIMTDRPSVLAAVINGLAAGMGTQEEPGQG